MIVQKFIDTGEYPSHYRILTLFGEPIFGFCAVSTILHPALDAAPEVLVADPFMAKHGQRRRRCTGVNIIRESGTGRLFMLEINPGGLQSKLNTPDLSVQFDAWKTCARVLVQRTHLEAM